MRSITNILIGLTLAVIIAAALGAGYLYFVAGGGDLDGIKNIFPFGNSGEATQDINSPETSENEAPVVDTDALTKIYSKPISGATVINIGTKTLIRFVDRETGNIYEADSNNPPVRLTNTTIPRTQEALWEVGGKKLVLRYIRESDESVETFLADIPNATTTVGSEGGALTGTFLPANIRTFVWSPSNANFFYLLSEGALARGFIGNGQGNPREIFSTAIREWNADWSSQLISLTTKPSEGINGFSYLLNPQNERLEKTLSNIEGLTTLTNTTGDALLYNIGERETKRSYGLDLKTNEAVPFNFYTLPEKCTWSKNSKYIVYCGIPKVLPPGNYPDAWYQGRVSFSDELWSINVQTGTTTLISELEEKIDITNPRLSPDESLLIFTNKQDGGLWKLEL